MPSLGIDFAVTTPLERQELISKPVAYWEGVIDIAGTRDGKPAKGHGYLELTGYSGPLVGLSSPQ